MLAIVLALLVFLANCASPAGLQSGSAKGQHLNEGFRDQTTSSPSRCLKSSTTLGEGSSTANGCLHPDEQATSTKWLHGYIDEQTPEFSVKIHDETADQRLGNIIRASYLTKVIYFFFYKFDSPIAELNNSQLELLAAGSKVNDTLCSEQLSEILTLMEEMQAILRERRQTADIPRAKFEMKHLRLAKFLDSFGRYEAGLLLGRTHSLGSYNQCKGTQLLLNDELVTSRYCMANLDVSKYQHASLEESKKSEPVEDLLSVAVCLPESCHSRNFAQNRNLLQTLINSQFELPASIYQERHLQLRSVYCEPDPDSVLTQVPLSGKLLMLFLFVWIGAVLYATYRGGNKVTSCTIHGQLVQCLDLRNSWKDFICDDDNNKPISEGPKNRVSLCTLNPVKVFGCMCIVLGHAMMTHLTVAMDVFRAVREFETDPIMFLMVGFSTIVDSFYVITGLIVAFIALNRFDSISRQQKLKEKKKTDMPVSGRKIITSWHNFLEQCFSFILVRYLRLIPLYFLVFWFKKSLMTTLSSGPFWDHGYNKETEAGSCRKESWLTPFILKAAYLRLNKQCLSPAWSVASDLLSGIIVAPILVLMTNRPRLALLLSVIISLGSSASMLIGAMGMDHEIIDDLMESRLIALSKLVKSYSYLYTEPHYRVFSILIGVIAGYALYHYNRATDDSHWLHRWPDWFRGPVTKAAILYTALNLGMPALIPCTRDNLHGYYPSTRGLFVYGGTVGRLIWASSNAIIFLRMITDWKDSFLMRNSAGKFWNSMSKLNYPILLIHLEMLKFDSYMQLNTNFYSRYAILRLFTSTCFLCLPIAMILYILFENPINKLIKSVTNKRL